LHTVIHWVKEYPRGVLVCLLEEEEEEEEEGELTLLALETDI